MTRTPPPKDTHIDEQLQADELELTSPLALQLPMHLAQVYLYYDGPQIYTAVEGSGRMVLVMEVESSKDGNIALAVHLAQSDLNDVVGGNAPRRDAFDGTLTKDVYQITRPAHGPESSEQSHITIRAGLEIPEKWLPDADAFLDGPDSAW